MHMHISQYPESMLRSIGMIATSNVPGSRLSLDSGSFAVTSLDIDVNSRVYFTLGSVVLSAAFRLKLSLQAFGCARLKTDKLTHRYYYGGFPPQTELYTKHSFL